MVVTVGGDGDFNLLPLDEGRVVRDVAKTLPMSNPAYSFETGSALASKRKGKNGIKLMSYEIKKTANGKYMFNLKAGNHEVILTSEVYERKESALAGIESVRANGANDANFELKKSAADQPYFVLKAANTQVIGKSEMYSSEAAAKNGMESVKKNCESKEVKDLTAEA